VASATIPVDEMSRKRGATAAIFGAFVVAGVITTLLGPILPVLIGRWSLTDERAGIFFICQFGTSLAGVASLSALLPRLKYRATFAVGYTIIAAGIAGLNSPHHVGGLIATCLYGYGLGLALPASNLWVAEVAGSRRVAALSLLNFTWGIGAIACSPFVLIAQNHGAISLFLYSVAGLALVVALILFTIDLEPASRHQAEATMGDSGESIITAMAMGALFFLYVGVENCVGGWVAALAKRTSVPAGGFWALAPMFFWGGLLSGRALVPIIPLRKREKLLVRIGLTMGLISGIVLLKASTFAGIAACVAVSGLGFAAIYPVLVTWMAKHFGERTRRIGSVMFALAGLGGAVMPWFVGFFSTRFGALQIGLVVPVISCCVMLALLPLIPRSVST
jgi:MFS transporter, FHS family, glucose/mannose:H+ symporter